MAESKDDLVWHEPPEAVVVPRSERDGAKKQTGLILFTVLGSNLFALFIGGIYEFLSLRGVVNVAASRVVLFGVWVIGVVLSLVLVVATGIRSKLPTVLGSAIILAIALGLLDVWSLRAVPLAGRTIETIGTQDKVTVEVHHAQAELPTPRAPQVPPFWMIKSPARNQHKPGIHLIFKDSPLFTPERKTHITAVIGSFCDYLQGVGFTIPTDIPPLGTRPGNAMSSAAIVPGSIYDAHLSLPEGKIDDPDLIRALYSQWAFEDVIFGAYLLQGWPFSADLTMTYSCYYRSSFVNRNLCDYNWRDGEWVRALWDIRKAEGKEFTDKALLYTIKAWDPPTAQPRDFNDLFAMRFIKGIGVRDNDFKHAELAGKILARHGLGQSPQP